MLSAQDIADFVVETSSDAVDRIVAFVRSDDPGFEDWFEPEVALIEARPEGDLGERSTWERMAASMLMIAARQELGLPPSEPEEDGPDPDDGYRLLRDGDHDSVLAIAEALLAEAATTPDDDWNYGNLLHHAHILRGKVCFARGDLSASARELLAAGDVSGSPQLDSFGPDLTLAWSLLPFDYDQAVLGYFKAVARFWSPSDPTET